MKRQIVFGGQVKEIELPADASVLEVQPGVFSVLVGERSFEVRIGEGLEGLLAEVNGTAFEMRLFDPREASSAAGAAEQSGRRHVKAPMPGKVIRLLVAEGDSVAPGQGLVVMEAMKMQNELKSPKTGRVTKIATAAGATVAAGEVLVTLE